jgi:hypothetical protein
VSTAGAKAERQLDDHVAALSAGVLAPHGREIITMSWLDFAFDG